MNTVLYLNKGMSTGSGISW